MILRNVGAINFLDQLKIALMDLNEKYKFERETSNDIFGIMIHRYNEKTKETQSYELEQWSIPLGYVTPSMELQSTINEMESALDLYKRMKITEYIERNAESVSEKCPPAICYNLGPWALTTVYDITKNLNKLYLKRHAKLLPMMEEE